MSPQITVLRLGNSGPDVRALHEALVSLGFQISDDDLQANLFGEPTRDVIIRFQLENNIPETGAVDDTTARVLQRILKQRAAGGPTVPTTPEVPRPSPISTPPVLDAGNPGYLIEGSVRSARQPNLAGLAVIVVDHAVGGDQPVARAITDEQGNYRVTVPATAITGGKDAPDLQAKVYSGKVVAGSSEIAYNAGPEVRLDIELASNAASLPSEYVSLVSSLRRHLGIPLRELQENAERHDITYLANKTGWDARMVAFAALADGLSQPAQVGVAAETGVDPAWYYALFRAGVPTDEAALFRTDLTSVQRIWKQALEQNVIPAELAHTLPVAARAFQRRSVERALEARAFQGASTLGELLAVTLGDDAAKQQRFAELAAEAGSDVEALWTRVRAEFGEATEQQLRLDGELAIIANGRADLLRKLHTADGQPLTGTGDLASRGYYRADRWLPLVDGAVPDGTPGATPEEKRANYAGALAAQVRLRYPTLAVAEMVKSGETPLGANADIRDQAHKFLTQHDAEFDIASQPIARFIRQNNLEAEVPSEVVGQLQRLQRVYQITPGDAAMNGLLKRGIDSAYAVARYREDDFVREFAQDLGGEDQARLTHAKSRQVHHGVLNVATTYVTARRAVPIGVHSPPQIVVPTPEPPGASDITAYAKLEELVGSMDYCACEHCRSLLSPAAYLVDLFYFLENSASTAVKPLDVLFGRRPDLQYLPLTCENTNTALPYIDVVNEILEYFVTHNLALSETTNGVTVSYQGHTIDEGVTTSELLASPQFVTETAYDTLAGAFFPPPLPFNRPLEALRRHFAQLDVPLADAMETLRPNESLGPGPNKSYGWYDILLERLRLSRAERQLLVDSTITLVQRFGFAAGTTDQAVLDELAKVKGFCRRMGIGYDELIEILGTEFVNPGSTLIPRLNRLGVSFENLKKFKNGSLSDTQFDALVAPGVDAAQYGGDIKAWVKQNDNFTRIMDLFTIRNPVHPDDACAVEELELRHADPDDTTNKVASLDFVRLSRFIRLWKKLGWTVQQVDQAIMALRPAGPPAATPAALDAEFVALLPRLGVVRQLLDRLHLKPRDLSRLLAGWAPIGTHGTDSLYHEMFLRATGVRADAAFADNGYGDFLSDQTQTVAGHAETLRAAFNLTGEEFAQIFADLQFVAPGAAPPPPPPPLTPLTLANVSQIFRWGWLARTLKLSVRELRPLSDMAGLDPFAPIDPPDPPIMRLLRLVEALRASALKPVQALYLIWNQDLSGKSAPAEGDITSLARTLRSGFASIDREFALADDPSGELARARLAQVYGDTATDFFFGLLNGTLSVKTKYIHDQPTLSTPVLAAGEDRIAYDPLRQELSFVGEMTVAVRDALQALAGVPAAFGSAVGKLYTLSKAAIDPFRSQYPELMAEYATFIASTDPVETRRSALLARLTPGLRTRRKRQQALAAVSAAGGIDATLAQTILADPTVLHAVGTAATDRSRPALDDLTALENGGLTAHFFWKDTATGNPDDTTDSADLDYAATGTNKLPANPTAGAAISGLWSGHLEVPDSGDYTVVIESDAQGAVALSLVGLDVPLQKTGSQWTTQNPIALTGATRVPILLKVEKLTDTLRVRWQNSGAALQVPALELTYAATLIEKLGATYTRTLKLASLGSALGVTPAELAYLAGLPTHHIGGDGWANSLPVSGSPATATATALFDVLTAAIDFALLKAERAPRDERLLDVLQALANGAADAEKKLLDLTGWQQGSLDALLTRLGLTLGDLAKVENLWRVHEAYGLIQTAGMSGPALVGAVTNNPDNDMVRDLLSALRARYDSNAWNEVLRPINDELRASQRNALVAYILEKFGETATAKHIDTPEKLFEYFLMDVQMEPVMQTSRIRHALSSVQLFIERCLLNLEANVPPDRIDADQWAWMKRYRVWEANRKVFLWPENWLEPELRDDQSPFFKETMSELLQQDITEDTADAALLNYLSKLEEVAKLEPCGIYHIEETTTSVALTHVVARSAGAHRKYYYRRREGQSWSPWTQIKLDIEDNPVIPVIWKGRLLLFWLKIMKQGQLAVSKPGSNNAALTDLHTNDIHSGAAAATIQAVLCWSEYYNGKWQGMRTSDVDHPALLDTVDADPASAGGFDRSTVRLFSREEDDALRLFVQSSSGWSTSFRFYNTHSLPDVESPVIDRPILHRELSSEDDSVLHARYIPLWVQGLGDYDGLSSQDITQVDILHRNRLGRMTTVEPMHSGLANEWTSPFLVADGRHAFCVSTATTKIKGSSPYTMLVDPTFRRMVDTVVRDPHGPRELPGMAETVLNQPFSGVVDPAPMRAFVSEDAFIHGAIGSPGVVSYNGVAIGPAGALRNGHSNGR